MMQKIQDNEARIFAEQQETQISGIVLGSLRTLSAASGQVQHLEASSTAFFIKTSDDENRDDVGEDAAGGLTISNYFQVVATQHDDEERGGKQRHRSS